jgi:hypothetical protein
MQALKNRLATLGFIGLIAFALLPAGLSVCGPAVSKIAHHGKGFTGLRAATFRKSRRRTGMPARL